MTTSTVECPQCGRLATIEPDVQPFCRQCDSPLFWQQPRSEDNPDADDARVLVVSTDAPRMEVGCQACGYRSRVGRDFCEACGTPLRSAPVRQRVYWVEPVSEEDVHQRRKRIAVQILAAVVIVLIVMLLVLAIWLIFRSSPWELRTLDTGNASWDISQAMIDDRPVISYVDSGNLAVRVLTCASTKCGTRETTEVSTDLGSGQGQGTAIAITEAGLPLISYRSAETMALMVIACDSLNCATAPDPVQLDPPPSEDPDPTRDAGYNSAILIGSDGLPLISYWDRGTRSLMVAHCVNDACTAATSSRLTAVQVETGDEVAAGGDTAVALGPRTPMIVFRNENPTRLDLLSCADNPCTSGKIVTLAPRADQEDAASMRPGYENSMATDANGFPIVAYHDQADGNIYVVHCLDEGCADVERHNVDGDPENFNSEPSIALLNGNPVIAFRATPGGDESGRRQLKVVRCGNPSCSRRSDPEIVDGAEPGRLSRAWTVLSRQPAELVGRVGYSPSVKVTTTGQIVIAYGDATTGALKLAVSQ